MQPLAFGRAQSDLLEHRLGERIRPLAGRYADRRTALNDRPVKQPPRRRHRQQYADFAAADRLAKDRDVAGIPAEHRDIVADPTERRDEVQHPAIAGMRPDRAADIGQI